MCRTQTSTTEDLEDIAKAADNSKDYKGCPKCEKCPTRSRRNMLSNSVRWLRRCTHVRMLIAHLECSTARTDAFHTYGLRFGNSTTLFP